MSVLKNLQDEFCELDAVQAVKVSINVRVVILLSALATLSFPEEVIDGSSPVFTYRQAENWAFYLSEAQGLAETRENLVDDATGTMMKGDYFLVEAVRQLMFKM